MKPISKVLENANKDMSIKQENIDRREWALKQPTEKADRLFSEFASMWPSFPPQTWRPAVKENNIFLKAQIRWQGLIKNVPWEVVIRAVVRAYKSNPKFIPAFGEFEAMLASLAAGEPQKRLSRPKRDPKVAEKAIAEMKRKLRE